jgi:trk system potassium uptake protein TrkA
MKSILVIGLGRFGRHLASGFAEHGADVTVIDKDEEKVKKISACVAKALVGDCTDINVLRSLKVNKFERCFVCMSSSFQSSLEITSQLKELGAAFVACKTDSDVHSKYLLLIGADEVIYVERDEAQRTAVKYSANNAFEYFELTDEYAISEILVPQDWVGLSLKTLDLAAKHHVNVIGIKNGVNVIPVTDSDYILTQREHMIVAGYKKDIRRLLDK